VHDVGGCKINFFVHLRRGLMRRLGAPDSRLYYFLQENSLRSCTAHGGRRQIQTPSGLHTVEFEYATASLWPGGIRAAKPGWSQSLCFGSCSVDAGLGGYVIGRGPGRTQSNPASAGVSRLTAARQFDFLGFTSIFRMLSLSPRRKRAAALD
jgi:hypothetical protein